jgi:hypothetical protein
MVKDVYDITARLPRDERLAEEHGEPHRMKHPRAMLPADY